MANQVTKLSDVINPQAVSYTHLDVYKRQHPRCVNFLTEISNYTWDKDKIGNKLNIPIDDFNHLMDAMRYGLEQFIKKNSWLY